MLKKLIFVLMMLLLVAIPASMLAISDNYFSERTDIYIKQHVVSKTSDIYAKILQEEFLAVQDPNELVSYQLNNQNEISSIMINSSKVNELTFIAANIISNSLSSGTIEKEIESISFPLGQLVSKSIFAGSGPDIHIEVDPITSYEVDIKTKTEEYGLNNMLFEIYLVTSIEVQVMIPLKQETVKCEQETLIMSQIISGKVPYFYYSQ